VAISPAHYVWSQGPPHPFMLPALIVLLIFMVFSSLVEA
jgi:hypothetical protein